jgi:hypothetical protein
MNEPISKLEKKFGIVETEGKKYTLTGQALETNRDLGPFGYNNRDQNDGKYNFEMSAPAIDENGNTYHVYWIFLCTDDRDLDQYDYSMVDRIIAD